jgi:tetratricopeptide (TPR) repeat protein
MVNTLIVRDATLAVNGAPESRGQPEAHLRQRVDEVAGFDRKTVEECLQVLSKSIGGGEDDDPEILEALVVLGLSQPELAQQTGLSPLATGRKLAARLERGGEADHALAVLELLAEHFPGQKTLERDLAGLMRRKGMVQELVERYIAQAQKLLKQGKDGEAIEWLREVLLLDRTRKDIARMIRDLRYQEADTFKERKKRWRVASLSLGLSLLLTTGFLHEYVVLKEFEQLTPLTNGDQAAMNQRLGELETFMERHPIWHGSLKVVGERAHLRIEIDRIHQKQLLAEDKRHEELVRRREEANLARERGLLAFDAGDYLAALSEFQQALELSPPEWPVRERLERDIQAIHAFIDDPVTGVEGTNEP